METERNDKLTFIEKFFINSGKIVDIHSWDGGNMHERDVHLPNVDFIK